MTMWVVKVPGAALPHTTFAESAEGAKREAAQFLGLHSIPPGTVAEPLDEHRKR